MSAREPAIVLDGASKAFGPKRAVDGVTLRIPSRSTYGLIGPNGAGKTTTFSLIAGYLQPSQGTVRVLGATPGNVPALRGRLGVLPQDALLPGRERVGAFLVHLARLQGLTPAHAERAARAALDEVDGASFWTQRCGALSHGMAKRVGLAQALLGNPEVVLLDEPTAGLDPKIAHDVRDVLRRRKGAMTLLVSSHNLSELESLCDGAAILDKGRLVTDGTMAELTRATEEVRVLLGEGPVPEAAVAALPAVKAASFEAQSRELLVRFAKDEADAETVIAEVLQVLLREKARIRGLALGAGLERRVIDAARGDAP